MAEARTIESMQDGRAETETTVTDRFLPDLERTFNEHGRGEDVTFLARTLRDRGRNSPESIYGADVCAVLRINLPEFRINKGFLLQAKLDGRTASITDSIARLRGVSFPDAREHNRLRSQAEDMLTVTPDSFVIVYSTQGFVVVPATSVVGLSGRGPLYAKSVDAFFAEFLMCFVGDQALSAHDDNTLERLRTRGSARKAILFNVASAELKKKG